MTALIVLLAISVAVLVFGAVWTLVLRGQTSKRSGAEIGAEYMEEEMARRALRSGKTSLGRRVWFWGKGWAIEREAAFSYKELKTMWLKGSYGALLPLTCVVVGMLSSITLGGVVLLISLDNPIPGLVVVAAGIYAAWIVISGIRRA